MYGGHYPLNEVNFIEIIIIFLIIQKYKKIKNFIIINMKP